MSQTRLIFEKQWLHALLLAALLAGLAIVGRSDRVQRGQLWGVTTPSWFWLAVAAAVLHQVYVWICWRIQLHGSWITRTLGAPGFRLYSVGFAVLGLVRVALVFVLAVSNRDTLQANPVGLKLLAIMALIPAIYLFYSVKRYFGFDRHLASTTSTKATERRPSCAMESSG